MADITYGKGVFWRKVDVSQYDFRPSDLSSGVDARFLPYPNASIDTIVFDPPYMHSGKSIKKSLDSCYQNNSAGLTWRTVIPFYLSVAREAYRVLRSGGIFILKTQDTVVNHHQKWLHAELLNIPGYLCEDLFILHQLGQPLMAKKWRQQYHARKNHSYFLVQRKTKC